MSQSQPGSAADLAALRAEIDHRIAAVRTEVLDCVEARLRTVCNEERGTLRQHRARTRLQLRSLRSARFLMILAEAPERSHSYAAFVEPGGPMTDGVKNSIRACFSELRARLRALGMGRIVQNRYRAGYFMTLEDAARLLDLIDGPQ